MEINLLATEGLIYFFDCFAKGIIIKTFVWKQNLKTSIGTQHAFYTFNTFTDPVKPQDAVPPSWGTANMEEKYAYGTLCRLLSVLKSPGPYPVLC